MRSLELKLGLLVGPFLLALTAACSSEPGEIEGPANKAAMLADSSTSGPLFEVDPFWPKPLPNHWLLGSTIGVAVDSRDHVLIVHRGNLGDNEIPAALDPPRAEECCFPAPPILEFDPEGNLVGNWGGPGEGYTWPNSNHGIVVDHMDNIWIGGNGRGDSHVLKFTRSGEFLLQVGVPGRDPNSNSIDSFSRVAKLTFDAEANEMYLADGYGTKRVAVIDADTGEIKRYWGAYGNDPIDDGLGPYDPNAPPAQQFRNPVHCADPTSDGLVYVCDRPNNRIQVFQKDGTFVDEIFVERNTLGAGSAWDVAFSRDPKQSFMYLADGMNEKVHVIKRNGLEHLYSFGDGGRYPGQFFGAHSIATDSKGNIYVTETYEGKRVQKFIYTGVGPVTTTTRGVVWPESP